MILNSSKKNPIPFPPPALHGCLGVVYRVIVFPASLPPSLVLPFPFCHSYPFSVSRLVILPSSPSLLCPIIRDLLIQHNAIHACLQERKNQTCFALETAQPIEDGCTRRVGKGEQECGHLSPRLAMSVLNVLKLDRRRDETNVCE